MAKRTIVLAGGGTGGHRLPVLAVAAALRRRGDFDFVYFGTEQDAAAPEIGAAGLPVVTIKSGKWRRYLAARNLSDIGRVLAGYLKARRALRRLRPAAVFVKGGYVSVPVALAAQSLRLPVITHESDAVLGLANRLIARRAAAVGTSYPTEAYGTAPGNLVYTGPIIRSELNENPAARRRRTLILILGGSQGARRINSLIIKTLPRLVSRATIIHQTGPSGLADAEAARAALPLKWRARYRPVAYISDGKDLARKIATAAIVVSRAGSTVFELARLGAPVVLLPLSSSAAGHQQANAEYFRRRRAAVVLDELTTTPTTLRHTLERMLADDKKRQQLSRSISRLGRSDGADRVAEEILKYV